MRAIQNGEMKYHEGEMTIIGGIKGWWRRAGAYHECENFETWIQPCCHGTGLIAEGELYWLPDEPTRRPWHPAYICMFCALAHLALKCVGVPSPGGTV